MKNIYKTKDNKPIVLIGLSGSGKTVIGRQLSMRTDLAYYDTDDLITDKLQVKITDIFYYEGEEGFRKIERKIFKEILNEKSNCIVSSGGGLVLNEDNRELIKKHCHTVFMDVNLEILAKRIFNAKHKIHQRPLFQGCSSLQEVHEKLLELDNQRREIYTELTPYIFKIEGGEIRNTVDNFLNYLIEQELVQ